MFEKYTKLIIDWNRERGLLDKFNPELSMRLLSEEAREFFMAKTFKEQLCEYADFWFVWIGCKAVRACNPLSRISIKEDVISWNALEDWVRSVNDEMVECLLSSISNDNGSKYDLFSSWAAWAMEAVIENNNKKGTKKIDGKITKPERPSKPTDLFTLPFIYETK